MAKHRVLLIGATGETGGEILDGLVEDGSFVSTIPEALKELGDAPACLIADS